MGSRELRTGDRLKKDFTRRTERGCRARRGFTLIEVLVVVAIIALLVSILLPSLAAARRQTRTVVCATNLSTIGKGTLMYAQANKDIALRGYWYSSLMLLPEKIAPFVGGPRGALIPRSEDPAITGASKAEDRDKLLAPVLAKINVLQCPSFPQGGPAAVTNSKGQTISRQPYCYVVNDFDFNKEKAQKKKSSTESGITKLDRIPSPARLVYVTDGNRNLDIAFFGKHDMFDPELHTWWGADSRMITDDRHGSGTSADGAKGSLSGKTNCLHFDGHVETRLISVLRIRDFTPHLDPVLYHP